MFLTIYYNKYIKNIFKMENEIVINDNIIFNETQLNEFYNLFKNKLKEYNPFCNDGFYAIGKFFIDIFANKDILLYDLHYDKQYNIISMKVTFNNNYELFIKCENGDENDDLLEFVVYKEDEKLFSKFDRFSSLINK